MINIIFMFFSTGFKSDLLTSGFNMSIGNNLGIGGEINILTYANDILKNNTMSFNIEIRYRQEFFTSKRVKPYLGIGASINNHTTNKNMKLIDDKVAIGGIHSFFGLQILLWKGNPDKLRGLYVEPELTGGYYPEVDITGLWLAFGIGYRW